VILSGLRLNRLKRYLIIGLIIGGGGIGCLYLFPWGHPSDIPRVKIAWNKIGDKPFLLFFCNDFPFFWSVFEKTGVGTSLKENAAFLVDTPQLVLRRRTGIRFTPVRWRLWLGRQAWFGWCPDGTWFLEAEGGILSRLFGRYLWGEHTPSVHWNGDSVSVMGQASSYGVFFQGQDESSINKKILKGMKEEIKQSKNFILIGPDGAVHGVCSEVLSGPHMGNLDPVEGQAERVLRQDTSFSIEGKSFLLMPFFQFIQNELPFPPWSSAIVSDNLAGFYFYGFVSVDGVPVPDVSMTVRPESEPFFSRDPLIPVRERIIGERRGWEIDLLPPWLRLYAIPEGGTCYLATTLTRITGLWDHMNQPLLGEDMPDKSSPILRVHARWPRLARSARPWLQFMAENDALPGVSDPRELELRWFPLLKWLETLGDGEIAVLPASGGTLEMNGYLWKPSGVVP